MTKKPQSYAATPKGIVIVDHRQLTNGAIVPNFAVDLYLPIIGYDGLGIWTTLLRQSSLRRNDEGDGDGLKRLARAGRMGYTPFCNTLTLLEELGIIKVYLPTGRSRMDHERARIELYDPPTSVPAQYTEIVNRLSLNHDFIDQSTLIIERQQTPVDDNDGQPAPTEFSNRTSTSSQSEPREVPNENFMEFSNSTSTPL